MEEVNAGTASKTARKAFLRNVQAYAHLALCCKKTAYSYVKNAVTERAPMGNAYKAWKKLCKRYKLKEIKLDYTSIEHSFMDCTIGSINENVEEWFLELEYWNTRMGKIKQSYMRDDLQMKAHIIDQLPKAYEAVKVKLSGAYTTTSMEAFKRIILDFWKRYSKTDNNKVMSHSEVKEKCGHCGKAGHLQDKCWSKPENKHLRPNGKQGGKNKKDIQCFNCGKKGHYKSNCRSAKKSGEGRPNTPNKGMFVGAHIKKEQNSNAGSSWEKVLADLGATCHVRNSAKELQDQEKISEQVCVGKSDTFVHVTMQGMVYLDVCWTKAAWLQK
jgi:hypothetical protein